jgi:hypothetical protein
VPVALIPEDAAEVSVAELPCEGEARELPQDFEDEAPDDQDDEAGVKDSAEELLGATSEESCALDWTDDASNDTGREVCEGDGHGICEDAIDEAGMDTDCDSVTELPGPG